jgi:hypothetical protein
MSEQLTPTAEEQKLNSLCNEHVLAEFDAHSADEAIAAMVADWSSLARGSLTIGTNHERAPLVKAIFSCHSNVYSDREQENPIEHCV